MTQYSWSDAVHGFAETDAFQPEEEPLSWWEFWDQILSGLAWLG
ncbi:MAG: hypothetical protein P8164_06280 [Gammaproteobacteria bacterium]|jgi:hypothetical protein